MAQKAFSPDAWTRARHRFVEDLTEDEKRVYFQATPESILYDASAGEKVHGATSTSRKIVNKLQPLVDALEQYGAALDVYSNTYPLVLSPLWGSIRIVLLLARECGKYFEKLADMFNDISEVLPRLRIYEQLFSNHEKLLQTIALIYHDILQFCQDAKSVLRRGKRSMLSLAWKPFEQQFGKQMNAFRRHRRSLNEVVSTSHMIEAAEARTLAHYDRTRLEQEARERERLQIFASMSSVDYEGQHRKLRQRRCEGTGTWILERPEYTAWKMATASGGLCCHGIPGSGKSVLVSRIVDDLFESPGIKVLYYYCDFAERTTLQPSQMYRALLKQSFALSLMSESAIEEIVEAFKRAVQEPHEERLNELLLMSVSSCAILHIIIDGLDECERPTQKTILESLRHMKALGQPNINLLVTSRDEDHLLQWLYGFQMLHVSSAATATDIQRYVSNAIQSSLTSGELTLRDPELEQVIVSRLVEKAQGMFLWVHFQINDLCEAASDADIRNVLEHLPVGLYNTYTRILEKIATAPNRPYALRALIWVACARRPLVVQELQEAVAFNVNDENWNADKIPNADKVIRSCHGLLVRESEDQKLRFAHHTVMQFLLSLAPEASGQTREAAVEMRHGESKAFHFLFSLQRAQQMIAELCATYLCFTDFETALSSASAERPIDLNSGGGVFRDGGPLSIPGALGFRKSLYRLPYKFLGASTRFEMPTIDHSKYLRIEKRPPPAEKMRQKYALLEYVIEFWPWHTRWLASSDTPGLPSKFWHLVHCKDLPFEFRPWGRNQHFGQFGCKECPVPDLGETQAKDLQLTSLLHWAAEHGHTNLMSGMQPHLWQYLFHERYHDETLLIACRHGQDAVIELLMARRNYDLSDGRAILTACTSGKKSSLDILLTSHTPDRYDVQSHGHLALEAAVHGGHADIVQLLLSKGVPGAIPNSVTGRTALHSAALNGHCDVVTSLLRAAELVSIEEENIFDGSRALHVAAASGHENVVEILLQYHAYPDAQDCFMATPLILAAANGHAKVVDLLLKAGADLCISGGKRIELSRLPMADRVPPLLSREKLTAIHFAAARGHDTSLARLTDPNLFPADRDGDVLAGLMVQALHLATIFGHTTIIARLLHRGVRIDSLSYGMTPLHIAAYCTSASEETIKILVEAGASLNALDGNGRTPFMVFLHFADVFKFRRLLELHYSTGVLIILAGSFSFMETLAVIVDRGPLQKLPILLDNRSQFEPPISRGMIKEAMVLVGKEESKMYKARNEVRNILETWLKDHPHDT